MSRLLRASNAQLLQVSIERLWILRNLAVKKPPPTGGGGGAGGSGSGGGGGGTKISGGTKCKPKPPETAGKCKPPQPPPKQEAVSRCKTPPKPETISAAAEKAAKAKCAESKKTKVKEEKPPPKIGYFASGGTHAVFSDLPMPEGDYQQWWHAKNSRYNMVLLSGIVALIGAMFCFFGTRTVNMNFLLPDYPYTEEELDEFEQEAEEAIIEKEEKEEERQDRVYEREQSIKERDARKKYDREVELMQKDIAEGGLSDGELEELKSLIVEREDFEKMQTEEAKRRKQELADREKAKKEREKERQAKWNAKKKEREAKQKAEEKRQKEEEKAKAKAKGK